MKTKERIKRACGFLRVKYGEPYVVLHGNLSRFTGLLIMINVTLFFVGGAVITDRPQGLSGRGFQQLEF